LQTSRVVAIVIVVAVIGVGLGTAIGYSVYQGRTTTYITNPGGLSTVTEMVVVSDVLHEAEYVCGNSSPYVAGTVEIFSTNSTQQYIFSPSGNSKLLTVTVTTEASTVSTTIIDSTVTLRSTIQDNTTVCPTIA
jgi:hypothetical protein